MLAIPEPSTANNCLKVFKKSEDELIEGIDAVGDDFHKMMCELNEMENMINGKDLTEMEGLMEVTNEYMDEHIKFSENLQKELQRCVDLSVKAQADRSTLKTAPTGGSMLAKVVEDDSSDEDDGKTKKKDIPRG